MHGEEPRDRAIEQLLRQRGPAEAPTAVGACVDGETLAAWTDGGLTGHARVVVERHLAGCARCLALMAALARTAPAQPEQRPLWRRWQLAWFVPVAAAATIAALWVAVPDRAAVFPSEAEEQLMARLDVPAGAPAEAPTEAPADAASENVPPASGERQATRDAAEPDGDTGNRVAFAAPQSEALGSVAVAGRGQPVALEDAREADVLAEARQEAVAPSAAARSASATAPTATLQRASADLQILSPDPRVRWRVARGRLERTQSGGAEWDTIALPAAEGLAAGSAPSVQTCWVVGAAGAIYVTSDGASFARVAPPEFIDLVAVAATDARIATVTAADGRTWRTNDQGATWSLVAP